MRTFLKRIGTALLFAAIALCLAPTLIPPFLDRIYFLGPVSDHFDGERFFNPGDRGDESGGPQRFVNRWFAGERAEWPERVAVTPGQPVGADAPCPKMKGAIVENWGRCRDRVGPGAMWATWIGHSTVLIQAGGLNILTDPIWSERASPFSWVGPKRVRAPGIRFEDLPKIDLVLISHNHYDHMDLKTLKRLQERDEPYFVTSLGNEKIMRIAGIPTMPGRDWGGQFGGSSEDEQHIDYPFEVTLLRNHHWSSRWGTDRNRALWSAFKVTTPAGAFFYAGDTGWGDGSWVREAAASGPYRLAIIPIGAYEPRDFMKSHHVDPGEAVSIHQALGPALSLGVHWGTFQLTFEGIDDPPRRLEEVKRARGIPAGAFITTEVGRPVRVP